MFVNDLNPEALVGVDFMQKIGFFKFFVTRLQHSIEDISKQIKHLCELYAFLSDNAVILFPDFTRCIAVDFHYTHMQSPSWVNVFFQIVFK